MDTNRNILIFGATGSVGAYTTVDLGERGYNIIAVGRSEYDNGFFTNCNVKYTSVDITRKSEFERLPEHNIDCVMHFAGSMPSKMKGYTPQAYIDSIVTGTLNVLEYTRIVGAKKIIFTQTRADSNYLMGTDKPIPSDIERKFPLTGDHAVYTICKNAAVDLTEHYYHQYGIKRFILRLPTIYAYHPDKYFYVNGERKMKAYRYLMEQAIKGEPVEIWGDQGLRKEIVYVKDLVKLIRRALTSDGEGGIYNVGDGKGVSLEEQIKGIVKVFGTNDKESDIICRPDKPNGRQFIHDISKTKEELGFEPEYDYLNSLTDFKKEMELNRFEKLWGNEEDYR